MQRFIFVVILLFVSACSGGGSGELDATVTALPPGDVARGAELYGQSVGGAPTCASCHSVGAETLSGPGLQGYAARAGTHNVSAAAYTYQSIVQPAAITVSGYANIMYNQYGQRLSPQQLADLVAYLLTL
jgi:mono/diheme cytochrome c family protein